MDVFYIVFVFTVATHRMFKKRNPMKFQMGNSDLILAVPLDRGRLYGLNRASYGIGDIGYGLLQL